VLAVAFGNKVCWFESHYRHVSLCRPDSTQDRINKRLQFCCWRDRDPGWSSRCNTRLQAGRSDVRIPIGARYLYVLQNRPGCFRGPHSLLFGWYGVQCRNKAAGNMKLTTHLNLMPRVKNECSFTSASPYAFLTWTRITLHFF
jgi:hypothetical protein